MSMAQRRVYSSRGDEAAEPEAEDVLQTSKAGLPIGRPAFAVFLIHAA